VDLIVAYEDDGWVEIVEVRDTYGSGRMLARARITPEGRKRMDELLRQGVQPEDPLAETEPGD
jgi:DNA-binding PadR family transcriptional regulator